jgi:hypothetical protein
MAEAMGEAQAGEPAPETVHRYPGPAIRRGYLASAGGGAASLVLAFAGHGNLTVSVTCITIFVLFAAYGARTAFRGAGAIVLDRDGLAVVGPLRRRVFWDELADVRLRYYATRRDGERGWMELAVRGANSRIALDSEIERFGRIAARCREEADARGVEMSPATLRNFDAALAGSFAAGRLISPMGARGAGRER